MDESKEEITRDTLSSACNLIQNELNVLKSAIENPKISELDILKVLKSSELGVLVAAYVPLVEKQQSLSELEGKSNITEYNIRK